VGRLLDWLVMSLRHILRSLWEGQFTPAPDDPTAPPLARGEVKISCDRCHFDGNVPASEFSVISEPCLGPQTHEAATLSICTTVSCPACGRLIFRFVASAIADTLLAAGAEVVPGISNAVEAVFKDVVLSPPPFDQEA
jgi:hypothetical protein